MSTAAAVDLGILADTNATLLSKVEKQIKGGTADDILAGYLSTVEKDQKAAAAIQDPVKRAERLNLVSAQISGVKQMMASTKQDLGDVVVGFMAFAKKLDLEVEDLFKPSPEQQARQDAAEARVKAAEAEMLVAPSRSTLFGTRDPVAAAKTEFEAAQSALVEVKAEVAKAISEKARTSGTEQNLTLLLAHGERAYKALVESHRILLARTDAIRKDKETAYEMAKKTKDMIAKLDGQITDTQAQLETAKELLEHASEDDPNYIQLKQDVTTIESKLQTMSSDRTALLSASREEAINAQEYVGYEKSAITMTGDAKALAAVVQTKNRNMAAKRAHYVSQMEQIKQIERAVEVIKTGNETDRRLLDTILSAGAAATNARQGIMQEQPKRLEDVNRKLEEQEEMLLRQAGIDKEIRDDFNRRFLGDKSSAPAAN